MLLNAVGRQTEHAGQKQLLIVSILTRMHELLRGMKACAAQLLNAPPWHTIAALIAAQIPAHKPPIPPVSLQVADG